MASPGRADLAPVSAGPLDSPHHVGYVGISDMQAGGSLRLDQGPYFADETSRRGSTRHVFIDDASAGRLVGFGKCACRLFDDVVRHGWFIWSTAAEEPVHEEHQMLLALSQTLEKGNEELQITLALSLNRGRGVEMGCGEVGAILRANDLHKTFCTAADCADRIPPGRTSPAGTTTSTKRALLVHGRGW